MAADTERITDQSDTGFESVTKTGDDFGLTESAAQTGLGEPDDGPRFEEDDERPDPRPRGIFAHGGTNDRVAAVDSLGFETYVNVLARFLRHEQTSGPLTISIEGPWGCGKSTLMRLLRDRLARVDAPSDDTKPHPKKAHTVWFNAWRHDEDSSMWAGFMLEFLRQISEGESTLERLDRNRRLLKYQVNWGDQVLRLVVLTLLTGAFVVLFPAYLGIAGPAVVGSVVDADANLLAGASWVGGIVASLGAVGWLGLQFKTRLTDPLERGLERYAIEPEYTARTSFIERFHSDFTTILSVYVGDDPVYVFVDDLDRCALPRAAELIQSINLMIGDAENVYFILGMDREKVAASIATRYEGLVPYLDTLEDGVGQIGSEHQRGVWYGNRFIEKFVQIPLSVPRPTEAEVERFLTSVTEPTSTHTSVGDDNATGDDSATVEVLDEDREQLRAITKMVAPALHNNPRRLKMFINLFRLQKMLASETGLLVIGDHSDPKKEVTPVQLGKFIGIGLRWPRLIRQLERDETLLAELYDFAESKEWSGLPRELHPYAWDAQLTQLLFASVEDGEVRLDTNEVTPASSLEHEELVPLLLSLSPTVRHTGNESGDAWLPTLSQIAFTLREHGLLVDRLLEQEGEWALSDDDRKKLQEWSRWVRGLAWDAQNTFDPLPPRVTNRLDALGAAVSDVLSASTSSDRQAALFRSQTLVKDLRRVIDGHVTADG